MKLLDRLAIVLFEKATVAVLSDVPYKEMEERLYVWRQDNDHIHKHGFFFVKGFPAIIHGNEWCSEVKRRVFTTSEREGTPYTKMDSAVHDLLDSLRKVALDNEPTEWEAWKDWYEAFYGQQETITAPILLEIFAMRIKVGDTMPVEKCIKWAKEYLSSKEYFEKRLQV